MNEKESLVKQLVKAYDRIGQDEIYGGFTERGEEIKRILSKLNDIIPKENRLEFREEMLSKYDINIKICEICGELIGEGYVVLVNGYDVYCSEECMFKEWENIYDKYDESTNYYHEWYQ